MQEARSPGLALASLRQKASAAAAGTARLAQHLLDWKPVRRSAEAARSALALPPLTLERKQWRQPALAPCLALATRELALLEEEPLRVRA